MLVFGATLAADDPRIDYDLEAEIAEARSSDPFLASNGRELWVDSGNRDLWIVAFANTVRCVAPKFGLKPDPTAAFVTAHAALSTGYGRSILARYANNPFGVKGSNKTTWSGSVIRSSTTEYTDGQPYSTDAVWRVYPSLKAAITDHLRIVTAKGSRYALAADRLRAGSTDYMAQLGRDGWYTDIPEKVGAQWLDIVGRVNKVLATAPGPSCHSAAWWGLAGVGIAIATYLGFAWWRKRHG